MSIYCRSMNHQEPRKSDVKDVLVSHFCQGPVFLNEYRSEDDESVFAINERIDNLRPILSERDLNLLSKELPLTHQHGSWKRLYSLARDGASFTTLLDKVEGYKFTLLVIRTTQGVRCGGFATQEWKSQRRSGFYGTGQSFLFSFDEDDVDTRSKVRVTESVESTVDFILNQLLHVCAIEVCDITRKAKHHQVLNIFKWTGKNRYFQLCSVSEERLAFGGGGIDGNFGLCVERDFVSGSSGYCDTFGNEPLAREPTFFIEDMEVYGISSVLF